MNGKDVMAHEASTPAFTFSFVDALALLVITNLTLVISYLATLYYNQAYSVHSKRTEMVSQKVYDLCHGQKTVSSELAHDPTLAPGSVAKKLYGDDVGGHDEHKHFKVPNATKQDLQKAFESGKWGSTRPSDLFLKVGEGLLLFFFIAP